mmetsp:Transcript_9010/g.28065  ORF Transcript_9010/g.28065 Transcript_9010/m.28065 type:complete len:992 (+) Transcript_9010:105-3080(+)
MARRRLAAVAVAATVLGPEQGQTQVTWGPGPLHLSEKDDLSNQQRLYELLRRGFFTGYGKHGQRHALLPAIQAEIADFRQKVPAMPSLALAVAMAKYHFAWYRLGEAEMDVESIEDAANLMYASIQFSGCDRPDLSPEAFFQRLCSARWPYVVLLYSELGREFASRYLTEHAATTLERALAAFDQMKRLPYYAPWAHWQGPYDMNFNEEWFSGMSPSGPVWDKSLVPLAKFLEDGFQTFAGELDSLLDRGLFDDLHFEGMRAEGQDTAPDGGWRAVELMALSPQEPGRWATPACRELPRTCASLEGRPELQGCQHASASLVRLRAGGRLKPQFGAAPKLQCHLALRADIGARMSVGNQTLAWRTGEAAVFDDTFIRQEWHAGMRGEQYVLQIAFCHPCEDAQRPLYGSVLSCPPPIASTAAAPQALLGSTAAARSAPAPGAAHAGSPVLAAAPIGAPFAAAALWAATQPELAKCAGIGEQCPPDTQHGGPNPLSAVSTWNYALNNLKAAVLHAGGDVDPALLAAVAQVQAAMQRFLALPALEHFAPIVASAAQIFEAMAPWLRQQPPAELRLPAPATLGAQLPSDGQTPVGLVTLPLAGGLRMPAVGFGTWKLEGSACYNAVRWALDAGIRHVDTAEAYGNEADVGRAMRDSGVPRGEIFLATKATSVPLGMAEPSQLQAIFAGQLQALMTDYVEMYMLHAAGVRGEQLRAVWQGMEALHDLGRVRALGVSNFGTEELEELWSLARVKPVYLQNIFKVYKPGEQILSASRTSTLEWASRHSLAVVGYSVANSWPQLLPPREDPHVLAIARARGRTASQVLHRWALQNGVAVIPKASSRERILENSMLFDFELAPGEMALLNGLATLSESTHEELRPAWSEDVFGLHVRQPTPAPGLQALPAAGARALGVSPTAFREELRDRQCRRDLPGVQAEPFSLGGGGHQLSQCQAACASQASCHYITYYHSTGFCHMFRGCPEQHEARDGAVIYARL